jgi:hypothetical protein
MSLLALVVLFSGVRPTMARDTVTVPFRTIGSPILVEPVSDDTVRIVAQGRGTHLGRYTSFAKVTIVPQGPGNPPAFDGSATFVAANGDQLHVDYSGVVTNPFPNGEGEGAYQITGGTGRFGQASGQGAFVSRGGITVFSGTIDLPIGR